MSTLFALYRFYNADGELLYIGQTINPGRRMDRHRSTKEWWREVARIDMEQLPDRPTLLKTESTAVAEEKPKYNIRMNGSGKRGSAPTPPQIDGLVGRWFHSWEDPGDEPRGQQIVAGRAVVWQGQVLDEIGDDSYLVQLYSWWDGSPHGGARLVTFTDMYEWTFYSSSEEMQLALPCGETFDNWTCRNPRTHRHDSGYSCWKCARYYSGAERV